MVWKKELIRLIRNEYAVIKSRNHRYSLRKFAGKLKTSAGNLSEFLAGKREITKEKALQIISLMNLGTQEKDRLAFLMGNSTVSGFSEMAPLLRSELQKIIKDWRNFIILSVLFHENTEQILPKIASFTGFSEQEVLSRLNKFRELFANESEFINFQIDPLLQQSQIFTGESLKEFHQTQLEFLAKVTAESHQGGRPLFYNLTLFTTASQKECLEAEVREVLLKYIMIEPDPGSDLLVQFSSQMIPLEFRQ